MELEHVKAVIAAHQAELRALGVKSLAVFGSVARGEARPDSDVDLLVEFDRPIGLFGYFDVQEYVADLLGVREVDLVVRDAVIKELQEIIYREAIDVL
ncbi:MAG: nucleotidyltransferase family protein [Chloroflexi bacterium]|nr:nucleotidyltransferase family protein [Chloroflexota bacterium]